MFVITPDALPLRSLNALRREVYARARKRAEDERAERLKHGAFLESGTDWSSVREFVKGAGVEAARPTPDNGEVRALLTRALQATHPLPAALDEFDAMPVLDTVGVRLRVVSEAAHSRMLTRLSPTAEDLLDRVDEATKNFREYVGALVDEVTGLLDANGEPVVIKAADGRLGEYELDILEGNGLLLVLHNVAREYQVIDPFSRPTFGGSPPSISGTTPTSASSARRAQPTSRASKAATEAGLSGTQAPGTSIGRVLRDFSSERSTETSTPPSDSITPSAEGPASMEATG